MQSGYRRHDDVKRRMSGRQKTEDTRHSGTMNAAPRRIPPSPFSGGVGLLLLKLDLQSVGEERRTAAILFQPKNISEKKTYFWKNEFLVH